MRSLSQDEIEAEKTNLVEKLFALEPDFPTVFTDKERVDLLNRTLVCSYPESVFEKN